MNTLRIPIRKMHCRACEIIIERTLLEIPGIKKAEVSLGKHAAIIHFRDAVDVKKIGTAVAEAGYEVGEDDGKKWFSTDQTEYGYLAIGAFILVAGYLLLSRSGISISFGDTSGVNLFTSFLIGLTAGVSTCMALIGGLTLGIAARHAEKHPESSVVQKFRPHLFFNFGRVVGFFLLGGVLGALGGFFVPGNFTRAVITMVVAAVMLLIGLQLIEIFPKLSGFKLTLPPALGKFLGIEQQHTKEYSHRGAVIAGALTFFLPCGFTQMMQLSAIGSGSFITGALIMAAFAIGTAPGLLGIGGLTSIVRGSGAKIFFKTAGLLVIAFAIFNFANGYRLTGFVPFWEISALITTEKPQSTPTGNGTENVQVVRMTQKQNGYEPNSFTIKKGVPVQWIITSETLNSCAAGISMPTYGISEFFKIGTNTITFTPDQTGVVRFSCPMGMYTGQFHVVE